jgi:GT2 family glycosyltransferase
LSALGTTRPFVLDLTIVIVSYRCRELLRDCLRSLEIDDVTSYAKVVVVDNDSADGTDDLVAASFPWVQYHQTGANLGFAKANNLALAAVSTEYVLLLNPDTVVPPLALQRCLTEVRARPEVGVLGCKLVMADGRLDHACKRSFPNVTDSVLYFLRLDRIAFRLGRRGGYTSHHLGDDTAGEVDAVNGAFMLVRTSAMAKVGLLDEDFWMYGEDIDWCLRFWQAGWKIYYWPGAVVVHLKGGSEKGSRSWRSNKGFHEAMWLFYSKHHAAAHSRLFNEVVHASIIAKLGISAVRAELKTRRP